MTSNMNMGGHRRLASAETQDAGIYVTFTLSIPGSAREIIALSVDPKFSVNLQTDLTNAGIDASQTKDVRFSQAVIHPNHYIPPPSGLTIQQLLALMASFVAGVLVSCNVLVSVWTIRLL